MSTGFWLTICAICFVVGMYLGVTCEAMWGQKSSDEFEDYPL